jgi:hypothetical protein
MELLLVLFSFGLSPIDSFFLFYPPYVGGITAIPIDPLSSSKVDSEYLYM